MKRKNIPTHKHITENKSVNFLLHHITDSDLQNISDNEEFSTVNYDHKDDYFVFFLLQEGIIKGRIDFKRTYDFLHHTRTSTFDYRTFRYQRLGVSC